MLGAVNSSTSGCNLWMSRVQMAVFNRRKPRCWPLFAMFLALYVLALFFIGLEQWELWAMVLIIVWVRWCLRT